MIDCDARIRVCVKLGVPAQRLRDAFVIVVENRGKRLEKVGRKHGAL